MRKLIIKIQSISDIITNSSSEVFVINNSSEPLHSIVKDIIKTGKKFYHNGDECGSVNEKLKLSDREWVCTECGAYHNRDFNAAINLEQYFTNQYNTAGTAEINACGDNASTLRAIVMQVMSLKQEAPFL